MKDLDKGDSTPQELMSQYCISRSTYYRWIQLSTNLQTELNDCRKSRKVTWFKNKYQLKGAGRKPTLTPECEENLFQWFLEQFI